MIHSQKSIFTALFLALFLVLSMLISAGVASAANYCNGGFPHSFYGDLDINSADAPAGTIIRAKIAGEVRNNYTTTVIGAYGNANTDDKFGVAGRNIGYDPNIFDIPPNITFEAFVNGVWAPAVLNNSFNSTPYECGEVDKINLNAIAQCPDSDGDGVCNDNDICPGFDDTQDTDGDGTPNGCDACPLNNPNDSDGDGSCDINDICPGQNDFLDSDSDSIPNCLDFCPQDPTNDLDEDGVCGQSDNCPDTYNPNQDDVDNDGIGDECDECTDVDEDDFCLEIDDCDDNNPFVNPNATEVEDSINNDCDGQIDEGTNASDDDNDGFTENQGDCNDNNQTINPGAQELCDNVDNDCDANTADGVDEPGYGDPTNCGFGECASVGVFTCINGQMTDTCQPGPPAIETCDGLDNDCNGVIDNNALLNFFQDFDIDTYGNPIITQQACQAPQGYVANDDDCNDNDININPAAQEVCDQVDNDCDGFIDEGNVCGQECLDEDQDGVCDNEDLCEGFPNVDNDNDGTCNSEDECPDDELNDADGDNVCGSVDQCPGFNDNDNADGDNKPDGCDTCPNDPLNDADNDSICGDIDKCPGFDDNIDQDKDGTPDGCDGNVEQLYNTSFQIYDGWSSIALPFEPAGIDNSEELGQAISDAGADCAVIMKFNGNTQLWEEDILGLPDPSFALSGTEGYFIHCDNAIEFEYEGTLWV